MPKKSATKTAMAVYVFDSDEISTKVSGIYGRYVQGKLLAGLKRILDRQGGWKSLPNRVQACHGDLLETSAFGGTPGAQVLRSWVNANAYGLDLSDLDEDLKLEWESEGFLKEIGAQFGEDLGGGLPPMFVPYLVGFHGLPTEILDRLHAEIGKAGVVGYKGRIVFRDPGEFKEMAAKLVAIDGLSGTPVNIS